MINKSIFGYAMLEYMSQQGKDIWDMYIPLVCESIVSMNDKIDSITVKERLKEDYGIDKITYGAVDSILKRMYNQGILVADGKKQPYKINYSKVAPILEKKEKLSIATDFDNLCKRICDYAKAQSYETTPKEVEGALLDFLQQYGDEIIIDTSVFASKMKKKRQSSSLNYIISKFVLEYQNSTESNTLEKIAKGHVLSRITSLDHFEEYVGKMSGVIIALDAPIIYGLLGLNGDGSKLLNEELLNILEKQGCKFVIYRQHYQEVNNALNDAMNKLMTRRFSENKISRVMRYALRNGMTSEQMSLKIQSFNTLLENRKIILSEAPDLPSKYKDIDVSYLEDRITKLYKLASAEKLQDFTKERIENDADVISYIFRLRNNCSASSLRNCTALFITNNNALAYASKDREVDRLQQVIPVCMTDVLLSTMLWLNFPQHNTNLNKKILLDICYCNTTIKSQLLNKFYSDLQKRSEQDLITDEMVLTIKSSPLALKVLEEKTFNQIELYTDLTPDEVIQNVYIQQDIEIEGDKSKLERIGNNIHSIAHKIAVCVFVAFALLLISAFMWVKHIDITDWSGYKNIVINSIYCVIVLLNTSWGICSWAGWLPASKNIIVRIEEIFERWFKKLLIE